LGAEREADDGDRVRARALEHRGAEAHVHRVHADGGEAVLLGFFAQLLELVAGGVGLQEGVIDHRGEIGRRCAVTGAGGDAGGAELNDVADGVGAVDVTAAAGVAAAGAGDAAALGLPAAGCGRRQLGADAAGDLVDERVDLRFFAHGCAVYT